MAAMSPVRGELKYQAILVKEKTAEVPNTSYLGSLFSYWDNSEPSHLDRLGVQLVLTDETRHPELVRHSNDLFCILSRAVERHNLGCDEEFHLECSRHPGENEMQAVIHLGGSASSYEVITELSEKLGTEEKRYNLAMVGSIFDAVIRPAGSDALEIACLNKWTCPYHNL